MIFKLVTLNQFVLRTEKEEALGESYEEITASVLRGYSYNSVIFKGEGEQM